MATKFCALFLTTGLVLLTLQPAGTFFAVTPKTRLRHISQLTPLRRLRVPKIHTPSTLDHTPILPLSQQAESSGLPWRPVFLGVAAVFLGILAPLLRHQHPGHPVFLATLGSVPRRTAIGTALVGVGACSAAAVAVALASAATQPLTPAIQRVLARRSAQGTLAFPVGDVLRLVFHDVVSFDPATRTGGFNGSIRFAEELARPENEGLAPIVAELLECQKEVQAATGVPVSFADVSAVAGLYIIGGAFKDVLCAKTDAQSCDVVYNGYGNKLPSLRLGRVDAPRPEPAGRVPWVGAPVSDFVEAGKRIGLLSRELCAIAAGLLPTEEMATEVLSTDPQCASTVRDLEMSKRTTTRTSYEVLVFRAYVKMVNVALFNDKLYSP